MLFLKSIPPLDRKRLLEQQRDEWANKLQERQRDREQIGRRSVDRYQAALLSRAIEHLERDIAWVQNLIEGKDQP